MREAEALIAKDRESHGRDLFMAIEKEIIPLDDVCQIMTGRNEPGTIMKILDITKIWRHAEYPFMKWECWSLTGIRKTISRRWSRPFTPACSSRNRLFLPIILQGRLFVYGDAQRYRLE